MLQRSTCYPFPTINECAMVYPNKQTTDDNEDRQKEQNKCTPKQIHRAGKHRQIDKQIKKRKERKKRTFFSLFPDHR